MGLGLAGAEADGGNIGAVWVLSSSLGVWGFSGGEACQINRFRDSLEKISVNDMKPYAQPDLRFRYHIPHGVKAL